MSGIVKTERATQNRVIKLLEDSALAVTTDLIPRKTKPCTLAPRRLKLFNLNVFILSAAILGPLATGVDLKANVTFIAGNLRNFG